MSVLAQQLVDLLVDAPVSFAALYRAANQFPVQATKQRIHVDELWGVLTELEEVGWIESRLMLPDASWTELTSLHRADARQRYAEWLPTARYEDMSVDDVGLWFEIQPAGRAEWAKSAPEPAKGSRWMLDQDSATKTITIWAENLERAERALADWLVLNPDIVVTLAPALSSRYRASNFGTEGSFRVAFAFALATSERKLVQIAEPFTPREGQRTST